MSSTLKANILKTGIALVLVSILGYSVFRYVKLHGAPPHDDVKAQIEERVRPLEKRIEELEKKVK